jgi:putative redox protein
MPARGGLHEHGGRAVGPRSPGQVVVTETGEGKFLERVVAGDHHFLADEPVSAGGLDDGPSPYDLLAAALGTCTAMTVRLVADRRGMALDRVTVEVDHGREHATDCVACADGHAPMIDRFECRIRLDGELSPADRARLLAIADHCPVHRTLAASSTIVTELVAASASSPSTPERSTGRRAS